MSAATELQRMNGGDSAAACLGDAHPKAIREGARKTPPPTPVSPERTDCAPNQRCWQELNRMGFETVVAALDQQEGRCTDQY
jgi:hypothetical protein